MAYLELCEPRAHSHTLTLPCGRNNGLREYLGTGLCCLGRVGQCGHSQTVLLQFQYLHIHIFFFFAATMYRNFSNGNLVFYKASLVCGWWSKSVFSRAAEGWIQVTDHRWDKVYLPIAWRSDGWNSLTSGSLGSGSHNPHKGYFVHGWMQNCCGGRDIMKDILLSHVPDIISPLAFQKD